MTEMRMRFRILVTERHHCYVVAKDLADAKEKLMMGDGVTDEYVDEPDERDREYDVLTEGGWVPYEDVEETVEAEKALKIDWVVDSKNKNKDKDKEAKE